MSDEHLSFDELAELAEGLLARRKAAEARAHLAECETCGGRATALEAAGTALHDLGPVTMPAAIVERLDWVLADADAAGGETVVPDLGAVRRRRRLAASWPYAAAASVVAIVAVAVGVAVTNGNHDTAGPSAASGADIPLVATRAPNNYNLIEAESGQTYTADSVRTLVPQLLGGVAADSARSSAAGSEGSSTKLAPAPHPAAPSQAHAPMSTSQLAASGPVPAPLRRYANSRPALLACAAYITDTPNATPIAVDYARWTNPKAHLHQAPSLILVFEDPDDASILDVYVVAPACDSASLRDFTEVPKSG